MTCDLNQDSSNECRLCSPTEGTHDDCMVSAASLSEQERNRILGLIKHIHSVSGHGSVENLVKAMQRRGVPEHVLELAKTFRCPICEERKRVAPRRPASLETLPKKWQVVQSDMGSWYTIQSPEISASSFSSLMRVVDSELARFFSRTQGAWLLGH